jgi:hypothetical protein
MAEPSLSNLSQLFEQGHARIPESWGLQGPQETGLWWKSSNAEAIATPKLLRLAQALSSPQERAGLLLATEPRFREPWLSLQATRLKGLGERQDWEGLCKQITQLGIASATLKEKLPSASLQATDHATLELGVFGAPADQPAAAPGLLRALGATAALIEGKQGKPASNLDDVDPYNIEQNWVGGRLLQAPSYVGADLCVCPHPEAMPHPAVLSGRVEPCIEDSMRWVLETPWATLLGVLVFTMEAWASERKGGLQLELPGIYVQQYARPPKVQVVVTLADGQEILCGSLGAYCLRVLEALGMALVPSLGAEQLDQRLGDVIARLLQSRIWTWKPEARTRYFIGERFGFDCYRGDGHRYIYHGAESLSQALRSVAVSWAKERVEQSSGEVTA